MVFISREDVRMPCLNCNKYYLKHLSVRNNYYGFCSIDCKKIVRTKKNSTKQDEINKRLIHRMEKQKRKLDKIKRKRLNKSKSKNNKQRKIEYKIKSDNFINSNEWKSLRYQAIMKYGRKCMCCGAEYTGYGSIHVDHIKPRAKHPELALDINNLQILCRACNEGKSHIYEDDWRPNVNPM